MNPLRPPYWSDRRLSEIHKLLADPPDRYRPVPWLAWTGELPWDRLKRQLDDMHARGITEFFLFAIYGMEIPYMSEAYWQRVEQTLDHCRAIDMKCWIYDDYNWPGGVCAGTVLRDHPEARAKHLWLRIPTADTDTVLPDAIVGGTSGSTDWAIVADDDLHSNALGSDWCSRIPGYLDMLKESATDAFLTSTHAAYYARFAGFFPDIIPGFFNDEPGFNCGILFQGNRRRGWRRLPWTDDLPDAFIERYRYDLMDRVSDLVCETPTSARTRCDYWQWVAERFGRANAARQRAWCDAHAVSLTGHLYDEETLYGHVMQSGDPWEVLRHFSIPGIDLLGNATGYNYPDRVSIYPDTVEARGFHLTCKLTHSIVRHSGSRDMLSEAFGVCDWGLTLARQKGGLNYQAAMGVTLINDNSLITGIADFRKWSIAGKHFTQPWWPHYKQYADYNARITACHAEGDPMAEIGILYPRTTIWAHCNAADPKSLDPLQERICNLLDTLIRSQWDVDFIFEPILEQASIEDGMLRTPHARYTTMIVPDAAFLPSACLTVLETFARAGGLLLFVGTLPARDTRQSIDLTDRVTALLQQDSVQHIAGDGVAVCAALALHRQRSVVLEGASAHEFVASHRRFDGREMVFLANMSDQSVCLNIRVIWPYPVGILDPDTLQTYRPEINDNTFTWTFEGKQAVWLMPADGLPAESPARPRWREAQRRQSLDKGWRFSIAPGNMLRLPLQARPDPDNTGTAKHWQHDNESEGWLVTGTGNRLDTPILPGVSPWYWLRAQVVCDQTAQPRILACDNPDFLEAYVNGVAAVQTRHPPVWTEENVFFNVTGMLQPGLNTIHVRARTSKYNDPRIGIFPDTAPLLQPMVLLGEFRITSTRSLTGWHDTIDCDRPWEDQGMPHFAGIGIYRQTLKWNGMGSLFVACPACDDTVEFILNDQSMGTRAWAPYVVDLTPGLRRGRNTLELRVANTLGNIIPQGAYGIEPDAKPRSGLTSPPVLLGSADHVNPNGPLFA